MAGRTDDNQRSRRRSLSDIDAAVDQDHGEEQSATVRKDTVPVHERVASEQLELFVADLFDAAPKSDFASMEHPLFALKAGDREIRRYQRGDLFVEVQPSVDGLATIHDKDLWIYAVAQLAAAINRGEKIGRVVRFSAHSFLKVTQRGTSGRSYKRLGKALERLAGTRIVTNISTGGRRSKRGFGLLDAFEIVERKPDDGRMVAIEMVLPNWLYHSVEATEYLTLSREYFNLRKPLDRRLYEIARKHVGRQPRWAIGLELLHLKSGSQSRLNRFRSDVRLLAKENRLPEYYVAYFSKRDMVVFYGRSPKGNKAMLTDLKQGLAGSK